MQGQNEIWAFSEKPALLGELIAGARALADQAGGGVAAVVLGPLAEAEQAFARGADQVYWLGDLPKGRMVDDYVHTLAQLVQERQPFALLMASTRRGKAVAGRLAARLDTTVLTDVLDIHASDGAVQVRHMIFGGGAIRTDRIQVRPVLATVGPGVFPPLTAREGGAGQVIEVPFLEPEWHVTLRERKTRPAATVDLSAARKVVCPGRGLARKEDLAMIEELARAIGAEVGCTRPLAEGLGWLPRERYIGISGAHVRPDVYMGIGVSGQVQHLIGMSHSRVVVAINKDSNAPIFAHADYGIVGDLYEVVPALIKAIRG